MCAIVNLTFLYIICDIQGYYFHRLVNTTLKMGLPFLFANPGQVGI